MQRSAIFDLSVAASLWGGMYVVSAATFAAITPAALALLRLAIGASLLLLWSTIRGRGASLPSNLRRTVLIAGVAVLRYAVGALWHGLANRVTSLYWFNLSLSSLVAFPDLIEPIGRVGREIRLLDGQTDRKSVV